MKQDEATTMEDKKILVNLELSDVKSVLSFLHNFSHDSFLLKYNLQLLNKEIENVLLEMDFNKDYYLNIELKKIPSILQKYKNELQSNYEKEMSFIEILSELFQHMESERQNKNKEAEAKIEEARRKVDMERMGISPPSSYWGGLNCPSLGEIK